MSTLCLVVHVFQLVQFLLWHVHSFSLLCLFQLLFDVNICLETIALFEYDESKQSYYEEVLSKLHALVEFFQLTADLMKRRKSSSKGWYWRESCIARLSYFLLFPLHLIPFMRSLWSLPSWSWQPKTSISVHFSLSRFLSLLLTSSSFSHCLLTPIQKRYLMKSRPTWIFSTSTSRLSLLPSALFVFLPPPSLPLITFFSAWRLRAVQ